MPDQLEELLRRSLYVEAERVEPAGDGLRRIRERTSPPSRSRWRTPALVLAGAAAAVAVLVAAPSVLPTLTPTPAPPTGPSAAAPTSPGPTLIPGAGVNDMRTVWPYGTRADGFHDAPADQVARTYGDLTKPDKVATRFVGSYLGTGSLTARSLGAHLAGIRIEVSRTGTPISLVYLVRVRVGDDAPYVVVDAEAPDGSLTLNRLTVPASGSSTARGTLARPGTLAVQLRGPGNALPLARARVQLPAGAWAQPLSSDGTAAASSDGTAAASSDGTAAASSDGTAAALTAWTTGPTGVTAFASRPVG